MVYELLMADKLVIVDKLVVDELVSNGLITFD